MKKITGLNWLPAWTSLVGCIQGCLDYLKIAPSLPWLFGGSGHGFIINMSKDGSCPSSPTAWNTTRFFDLGKNIGYRIDGVFGNKRQPGFKEKQIKAWEIAKSALDQDFAVIGWELAIPEWYVINGYDEAGFYYNGPGADLGPSPKPWRKMGKTEIGLLEVYSIKPSPPAEDQVTIKEALSFALRFNQGAAEWVLPDYLAGQAAYTAWINAVRSGKARLMGHAYNAAVWGECRQNAAAFLLEAKKRIPGIAHKAFESAIRSYSEVAKELKDLTELYPFSENNREEPVGLNPRSEKAAEHLQRAKIAELEGLDSLEEINQELS